MLNGCSCTTAGRISEAQVGRCVGVLNIEILGIDHISSRIKELEAEEVEYVGGTPRSKSRSAQHMLKYGTSAIPSIVDKSAEHVIYPRSAKEAMTPPPSID